MKLKAVLLTFVALFLAHDNQQHQRKMVFQGLALFLHMPQLTSIPPDILFQTKKLISPTLPFDSKNPEAFLFTIRVYSLLKNICPFLTILEILRLRGKILSEISPIN